MKVSAANKADDNLERNTVIFPATVQDETDMIKTFNLFSYRYSINTIIYLDRLQTTGESPEGLWFSAIKLQAQ